MLLVINFSKSPVIASHSNAKQIALLDYNLSIDVLEGLKRNQGLVLVSFNKTGLFTIDNQTNDGIKQFVDHIDYLESIIGINRIGIGTDLQAYGKYVPPGLSKEDTFRKIKEELINRDYTNNEIELIFFRNYINFMK